MREDGGPTVVKLGGSLALSPRLRGWIEAIAACTGRVVLVPGGGPFADAVRGAQTTMGFDDAAAHRMALLAMEQYGCALASRNRKLALAASLSEVAHALRAGQVPVWMPTQMVLAAPDLPWSWDVTSDSLAAWLAGRIGARRLLLVKSVQLQGGKMDVLDVVLRGIVDKAFPEFLREFGADAFILGPDCPAALGDVLTGDTKTVVRIEAQ